MGRRRSSVGLLVEQFKAEYRKRWTARYGGTSMSRLSMNSRRMVVEVIGGIGLDVVLERLMRYFEDDSQWLERNAHPLGVFLAQIDQYRGSNDGKKKIAKAGKHFDNRWEV